MLTDFLGLPEGSQSAPRFILNRRHILRQQHVRYVVKPLPGKDLEMSVFTCMLCPGVRLREPCVPFNNLSLFVRPLYLPTNVPLSFSHLF